MVSFSQLHPWTVSPREAVELQRQLASQVRLEPLNVEKIDLIAGCDVSSSKDSPLLTAGVVVWSLKTGEVVEKAALQTEAPMPYVPGLLSFREVPGLLGAIAQLVVEPDLFMIDGHGIAHPRRLGIAAHTGLLLHRPVIGVAKSRLTGTAEEPGKKVGEQTLLTDGDEVIGALLRTKDNVKPVFVSPGNRIDLASSLEIVRRSTRGYRLPEPTRLAHVHVNAVRTAST